MSAFSRLTLPSIPSNLGPGSNFTLLSDLACRGVFGLCISGPPCETWSAARHLLIEGVKFAPRPLRSCENPWGLVGLSLKELLQLETGSQLMLNNLQLEASVVLSGGGSLMEHPAPHQEESYASIWRVPLHRQTCMNFYKAKQVVIEQWRYGAVGVKPTTLRCLNLGDAVARVLHDSQLDGVQRPQVLLAGLDDANRFKTSAAKEYPEGLCRALLRTGFHGLCTRKAEGFREVIFSQLKEREQDWLHLMSSLGSQLQEGMSFLPDYQPTSG